MITTGRSSWSWPTATRIPNKRRCACNRRWAQLRSYLDRRAVCHGQPDFIDVCIGQRDAAFGPIAESARPVEVIRQPMEEHVPTRRYTQLSRACEIFRIRIGDVNGFMKLTLRVMPI